MSEKEFLRPIRGQKITLRIYDVNERVFDQILEVFDSKVMLVDRDRIEDLMCGYPDRDSIAYDGEKYLIIREHLLAYIAEFNSTDMGDVDRWRQVIVRKDECLTDAYKPGIDGSRAYAIVKAALSKAYPGDEYDSQLRQHEAVYDSKKSQYHFLYPSYGPFVVRHSECVKYDMNGAHLDALLEIFPKAEPYLRRLFDDRKKHPIYKAYANFYVGMLKRKGYSATYNWIVQRTTAKLKDAIEYCGGMLIYANTDGFVVCRPERRQKNTCKLGEFKVEYEGDVFTYSGGNHWAIQCGDEIKGSIRYQARDGVDLRKGLVASYRISREVREDGRRVEKIEDIRLTEVKIYANG